MSADCTNGIQTVYSQNIPHTLILMTHSLGGVIASTQLISLVLFMCTGLTLPSKSEGGGSKSIKFAKSPTIELTPTRKETAAHKVIGIKEVKGRERTQQVCDF